MFCCAKFQFRLKEYEVAVKPKDYKLRIILHCVYQCAEIHTEPTDFISEDCKLQTLCKEKILHLNTLWEDLSILTGS